MKNSETENNYTGRGCDVSKRFDSEERVIGVYIKGIGMPASCQECPFLDYEEGFCLASGVKHKNGEYEFTLCPGGIKGGRHDDCPLVPVPPHGRLGDLDRLENGLRHMAKYQYDERQQGILGCCETIRLAPTIIPAEK